MGRGELCAVSWAVDEIKNYIPDSTGVNGMANEQGLRMTEKQRKLDEFLKASTDEANEKADACKKFFKENYSSPFVAMMAIRLIQIDVTETVIVQTGHSAAKLKEVLDAIPTLRKDGVSH